MGLLSCKDRSGTQFATVFELFSSISFVLLFLSLKNMNEAKKKKKISAAVIAMNTVCPTYFGLCFVFSSIQVRVRAQRSYLSKEKKTISPPKDDRLKYKPIRKSQLLYEKKTLRNSKPSQFEHKFHHLAEKEMKMPLCVIYFHLCLPAAYLTISVAAVKDVPWLKVLMKWQI